MTAIQAPFIMSVCAPTGTGKTHNTANFLTALKFGKIPLVHRFNTKHGREGDSFAFNRVHYLGAIGDESIDMDHRYNVQRITASGQRQGSIMTLPELEARDKLRNEVMRKNYRTLGYTERNMPKTNLCNIGDLIVNYLNELTEPPANSKREKDLIPDCIVIDDMSSFLNSFSQDAAMQFLKFFNIGSHHHGFSFIFIYQKAPASKQLGGGVFQSSHYIMFPLPHSASFSVQVGDFRTIMHGTIGKSSDMLERYNRMANANPRPNYIMFNKQNLITDSDLEKQQPPNHDNNHPNGFK